ncbi:iron chelate uptake ABC transporter family permease subunit [Kitasatospora purpeofusca]|uniref:FecCD family ABC transporter permease n=1 Tax=Kitasatospora purpeofusca TaxID=67352 RepID=UPI002255EEB4|nr:iron chelate uptake ABC transporter family permease subunit [Kitasatospora purpeofusca]MCX4687183.1 iron chelate uptake ABC transporter family permease subunit [Kitasatospora purpeofusca]
MSTVVLRGCTVLRAGPASFLLHRRSALAALGLLLALAATVVASLCLGESTVAPGEVLKVVLGQPSPHELVVGEFRLPRVVVGLLAGTAFGLAGALIQTVARNPLASPDVVGVSWGATATVVGLLAYGVVDSTGQVPFAAVAAVAGGLAAGLLVYLLAWRRGLHAQRFVLIGIGVSVALSSLTSLFLTKGDGFQAQAAKVWMTGSLNGSGYDQAGWLAWVLLAAVPVALWAARAQRSISFDDATAVGLGLRLDRIRLGMALLGVVLASCAAGAAGPVDFVALMAPQIAVRLARSAQIPLFCSALTGALVVVLADLLARRLLSPVELPVGVVTGLVGAPYLMWLLIRSRRGGS